MRAKSPRVVVTFHTTAEAMKTEQICQANHLDGRLISAPRSLSAGPSWSGRWRRPPWKRRVFTSW